MLQRVEAVSKFRARKKEERLAVNPIKTPEERKEHRREYMRTYMRQRDLTTSVKTSVTATLYSFSRKT
jgi:hypothetical protein